VDGVERGERVVDRRNQDRIELQYLGFHVVLPGGVLKVGRMIEVT
jgi:hypothetical protein